MTEFVGFGNPRAALDSILTPRALRNIFNQLPAEL